MFPSMIQINADGFTKRLLSYSHFAISLCVLCALCVKCIHNHLFWKLDKLEFGLQIQQI